jgi:hypothetical protein
MMEKFEKISPDDKRQWQAPVLSVFGGVMALTAAGSEGTFGEYEFSGSDTCSDLSRNKSTGIIPAGTNRC